MPTYAAVGFGVISLELFVIYVVAVATPGWIVIETEEQIYIGLFEVCVRSMCANYISYRFKDKVPFSHIVFIVLHIVGAILLFGGGVNSLRYFLSCQDGQARSIATKSAIMWSVASSCILAGVIWFAFDMVTSLDFIDTSSSNVRFGYSFCLAVIAGASGILVARCESGGDPFCHHHAMPADGCREFNHHKPGRIYIPNDQHCRVCLQRSCLWMRPVVRDHVEE